MRNWHTLVLVAFACTDKGGDPDSDGGGTPDGDADTDADSDSDPLPCEAVVLGITPEDGATGVLLDVEVVATFDVPITEADPYAIDVSDGASGTTTLAADGRSMTWTGALDFETTYDVTASVCDDVAIADFTTVYPPLDLSGEVYLLDLAGGNWVEPPGVGPLLAGFLGDTQLYLSPTLMTEAELTTLIGTGDVTGQDLCSPTTELPTVSWITPDFVLGGPSLSLTVADIEVRFDSVELSSTFARTGDRINDVLLRGQIDTRPLVELVDQDGAEDAVCVLVASLGVSCQACFDGSGTFCLNARVESISAPNVSPTSLVPRTEADIAADPGCTPP